MKIIAHAAHGDVIVQMTDRELANIVGKDYESELAVRGNYTRLEGTEIGTEYQVSKAWNRLRSQSRAANELEGVSKTLSALADLVTQTKVTFTNCTAEQDGGAK